MTAAILAAMQFSHIGSKDPINSASAPREFITYQFATFSQPPDWSDFSSPFTGWTAFTTEEKNALKAALAHIQTFLNVSFVEVAGNPDPDLSLGNVTLPGSTTGTGGYSISSFGSTISRWDGFAVYDNLLDLSQPNQAGLLLHELGHALGLKHPFSAPALPAATESNKYTVMSYSVNPDTNEDAEVMMLYDILALQDIWGAAAHNTGNTTYTGPRGVQADTVWDTGGIDHFDASGRANAVSLDLREAKFSRFGSHDDLAIAYGVAIENATGGLGDDLIVGNRLANVLKGGAGADTIRAGTGIDTVRGGGGRDTLRGQNGNDNLWGDGGNDRIFGDNGRDFLRGGTGRDRIDGGDGNDRMFGGGGKDAFLFRAGSGDDRILDFANDVDSIRFFGLGNVAAVQAAASQVGSDVVFAFAGGDSLTVLNTTLAQVGDDLLA